ncbi:cation-translocating P-type ATPase [Nocardioides marmoriginsengisoli]|uniref:Cation-translocating P-type ATPase n=1 Tax=Nocardioides marmoriginsengisoli TaxID=661483 RepID=A0A3N0CN10_9ACTN|nr:HAD family hydrolase [Nocardioides marmoriginsengisoli]RNL64847.1 cation-translocating P-type ATPase [Nocardioides marmoriginsengisoli]
MSRRATGRLAIAGVGVAVLAGAIQVLLGAGTDRATQVTIATFLALSPAPMLLAPALARAVAVRRSRGLGVRAWGSAALVRAARVDLLVLDKAGTVTTGALRVVSVDPLDQADDRNLRWFAGALCHALPTPVGRAVSRLAAGGRSTEVEEVPGIGVVGSVDRHPVRVGAPAWLELPAPPSIGHVLGVEVDGRPFGTITVEDTLRADAAHDVRGLHRLDLQTVLVSDDTPARTEAAARAAGVGRWHGELDGAAQAAQVRDLRQYGRSVAVVAPYRVDGPLTVADLAVCDSWPGPPPPYGVALEDLDVARLGPVIAHARRAIARARHGTLVGSIGAALTGIAAASGALDLPVSVGLATANLALVAGAVLRPGGAVRSATPV